MPGPVFIHFQTYARKESKGGNSVAQVVGEAIRDPEFSTHVENPIPPRVHLGDPANFMAEHDSHVAERSTKVMVKGVERSRAIRQDRHTLATAVASYPLTFEQVEQGGAEAKAHLADWERRTIEWMREKYGDQLRAAFSHDDEEHPHMHFWLLPDDPSADATLLHDGKVAKAGAEAKAKAEGVENRVAVKLGNNALKDAMRKTVTSYYEAVGVPLGMLRDGPKRRRESRAQYQSRKDQAQIVARTLKRSNNAESNANAILARAKSEAEAVVTSAEAQAEGITLKSELTASQHLARSKAQAMAEAQAIRVKAELAASQHIEAARANATLIVKDAEIEAGRIKSAAMAILNEANALKDRLIERLNGLLSMTPRIRKIIQRDDELAEEARIARSEIVAEVPPIRFAVNELDREMFMQIRSMKASEPAQEPDEIRGDGPDGPSM